jgi:hypothetical protein
MNGVSGMTAILLFSSNRIATNQMLEYHIPTFSPVGDKMLAPDINE